MAGGGVYPLSDCIYGGGGGGGGGQGRPPPPHPQNVGRCRIWSHLRLSPERSVI